jgi:HTH-type transcriptional regulator/antitoxin HigA
MKIKILKTEQDYKEAVYRLEELGDTPNFSTEQELINEFELLAKLIEDYENENYPIEKGNPIEIIKLKMDYMELKQKDLIGVIGSRGVVSEVINKKRRLSKSMIRSLSKFLNINQEILNIEYELNIVEKKASKTNNLKFLVPTGIDSSYITGRIKSRGVTFAMCS